MNVHKNQVILDNQSPETSVGEYLRKQLNGDTGILRIVSAYFTIYAYEALQDELKNAKAVRFLYGDPGSVGEVDPGMDEGKSYDLTERGLSPTRLLRQKPLARECAEWIKEKVAIRTIKQINFLHGKMYHVDRKTATNAAVIGSSNFTRRGLGFNEGANLELNLAIDEIDVSDQLMHWFDDIWKNAARTRDAKQDVLDALERIGKNYPPDLVYFKTLLEIFRTRMEAREETDHQLSATSLRNTQIWKTLYSFQRDGVGGIINRLKQYHGCILADSVGLGKTYTALAVIRYYQTQNQQVLVLCPKKLSENWQLYPTYFGQKGNPFAEDDFRYTVLYHTDLSRTTGETNGIDLANLDWSAFGLVVIDESHNFRNESRSTRDESGNIIRHSRYDRLLQDVINKGGQTDVLMLSATPVNTSLHDLRNQIYFMTKGKDDAFNESLGISNIRTMLSGAQKKFKEWEQQKGKKDKRDLFSQLGGDFFTLLDAVSIARSRRHIKKFYPEVVKEIGGFPEQAKPKNEKPPTDIQGELSFEELNAEIKNFGLSIYTPAAYVISEKVQQEMAKEKKKLNFNQADREKWLIGMIRVNFLKRLESAALSLAKTLERTIGKIDALIDKIHAYQTKEDINDQITDEPDDDAEDEEFVVNKARHPFHLKDLDLPRWLIDLERDRHVLNNVLRKVDAITPDRDGKLAALKTLVRDKITNPTTDKDERKNRKVLVFTAFKDTAVYLHKEIKPLLEELNVNHAMVAGDATTTSYGNNKFNDILNNFAPIGRGRFQRDEQGVPIVNDNPEIDVLIATDCVSEGQNLQDCDLVVNYDIHWNPVRLIQRFGRIDRIGSRNREVKMVNFWPMPDLDRYINLENRVEARMALLDASATGDARFAVDNNLREEEIRESAESELDFRAAQLHRLRDEVLDLDDLNDGVALSDFSLDDFIAQLMNYLEENRTELESIPLGVYTVTNCASRQQKFLFNPSPGVIFCLRHRTPSKEQQQYNILKDYFLIYVQDDGRVRYNYTHAKQVLEAFGELCYGKSEPLLALCDAFDNETKHGKNMETYNKLLDKVFDAIRKQFDVQGAGTLIDRHGVIPKQSEQPRNANDFELVTWLVIKANGE